MFPSISSSKQKKSITTIGFYNVENLFDVVDNPKTHDDDFTPKGKKNWNYKRYKVKIKKLGSVISQLGLSRSKYPPAIVGLVEVENARVVQDLVDSSNLRKHHYGFVHYDSPDERGTDVALLYNKQVFELIDSKTTPILLADEEGERDYTRDILKVSGNLHGELVHILVNHWSSRRDGADVTEHKRITSAETARAIIAEIKEKEADPKIIIMGDFNDDPTSKSVKRHLVLDDFYNPMESLLDKEKTGTLTYDGKWNLFDQIIFSKNFLEKKTGKIYFKHAEVFNKDWLKIYRGKFKGSPFRTYIGKWYQGGFSDHFPVYAFLKKKS
ncbi:Endonuclease/Exonuclease/phosphatase family protein [Lutibacter sp. Hel_I_33_5]|uniref:endonuclease/exonuclease/phosphatase family protein n=1 Tax=Lutibacter sp. Hel_I_33_5 TaxID=1566289 RepID=UPI00119D01A0|nr:endonuclease/exonuclease/phosphatase family protein [Lutibacter sp. Hel_I_33_5]TVZ56129.1 Endonuclease/Exonuclease/phosphatase family protein [Lutibacter sp. Hel_I_33_5]